MSEPLHDKFKAMASQYKKMPINEKLVMSQSHKRLTSLIKDSIKNADPSEDPYNSTIQSKSVGKKDLRRTRTLRKDRAQSTMGSHTLRQQTMRP